MGCSLVPSRMTHGGVFGVVASDMGAHECLCRLRAPSPAVVAKRTYPCEWLGGFWLAQTGAEQGHAGWETSGSWRLPSYDTSAIGSLVKIRYEPSPDSCTGTDVGGHLRS